MPETILIDLNEIFPPKSTVQTVQKNLSTWDISPYKNKKVQLKGCSPTWAHLMVMGKLIGTAESIDFLIDDSKGGISVPVYSGQ